MLHTLKTTLKAAPAVTLLLTLAWWANASPSPDAAHAPALSAEDRAALALGRRVRAVQHAIHHPDEQGAMAAVTDLGHDQRHYVMVRGWLGYQLQADLSLRDAARGKPNARIEQRIGFLQAAIRRIDLE